MAREIVSQPMRWWLMTTAWTVRERLVAVYIRTSPLRAGAGEWGLIQTTADAIGAVLAPSWAAEHIDEALAGLERRQWLVRADGWLFVPELLIECRPTSANQVKGAVRALRHAPRASTIWVEFLNVAQRHAILLYEALRREARQTKLSTAIGSTAGASEPHPDGVRTPSNPQQHQAPEWGPNGVPMGSPRLMGACEGMRDTTAVPTQDVGVGHAQPVVPRPSGSDQSSGVGTQTGGRS